MKPFARCLPHAASHWRRPPGLLLVGAFVAGAGHVVVGDVTSSVVAPASSAIVDGAPENGFAVGLGPEYSVESPAPGVQMFAPEAFAADTVVNGKTTKKVFVSFSRGDDVATLDGFSDARISDDGGQTFHEYIKNSVGGNICRLNDGSLLSMSFIPSFENERHNSLLLHFSTSTDLGKTWKKQTGQFVPPAGMVFDEKSFNRGIRTNTGIMVLNDGTILMPCYTQYVGDAYNRSILLGSRDGGRHWVQRSTIIAPTAQQGTNEAGFARLADGRFTAVLRTAGGTRQMLQVWSSDEGRTWTAPIPVKTAEGAGVDGINPSLVLQPNGILVMSFGRPDNQVLFSYEGDGQIWRDDRITFANAPEMQGAARNHGSSGNTRALSLSTNRSLLIGDTCASNWGCKQYDQLFRIWARQVEAVTPGAGKIDLATKVAQGKVTLSGTFAPASKAFPESRPQGAFDGSSSPHAAAMLSGVNRRFTIALDHTYTLNRIGLMLGSGQASDADVQVSLDGKTWSAPLLSARRRVDWCMKYQDFAPQVARFVRVGAPAGGSLSAVTQMELYSSDTFTFENDPVFGPPRGFTNVQNARITDQRLGGHESARSLYLLDYSVTSPAQATRLVSPRPRQTASFDLALGDFRSAFMVSVKGVDTTGAIVTPWHFSLASAKEPDRTVVRVYDGKSWNDIGTLKAPLALSTWVPITVEADVNSATFSVGRESFRTTTHWQSAHSLRGLTLASAGTPAYGGEFFVDDLHIF